MLDVITGFNIVGAAASINIMRGKNPGKETGKSPIRSLTGGKLGDYKLSLFPRTQLSDGWP